MINQSFTCLGGKRIKKSAETLDVLGDLDELNSILGIARVFLGKNKASQEILFFQEDLIEIGGWISGFKKASSLKGKTARLEMKIDQVKDSSWSKFSRPGVNQSSAFIHWSRSVTRRLERRVVGLKNKRYQPLVSYLNRLSLLLFWMAVAEEKR